MQIVERCRDPYGRLSESRRAMLLNILRTPDQQTWERARGLIIRASPLITLEMAVRSVRKNADTGRVPDPFTLYRAVRFAVDNIAA